MKQLGASCLIFLGLLFGAGFRESTRIIKINKDGAGVIHVRVLFNPDYLKENAVVFNEVKLKKAAGKFGGGGIRFLAGQEQSSQNGWKGYIAKYAFSDVRKLKIYPLHLPADLDPKDDDMGPSGWRFGFTKGGAATLKIIPLSLGGGNEGGRARGKEEDDEDEEWDEDEDDEDWDQDEGKDEDEWEDEDEDDEDAEDEEEEDEEQLQARQQGRRDVTYIQVAGKIVENNAKYSSQRLPNTIILNDEQWDVMWQSKRVQRLVKDGDLDIYELGNKVKGYRTVLKRVSIRFE